MNEAAKPDATEHVKEPKLKETDGNVAQTLTKYQSIGNDGFKIELRQVGVFIKFYSCAVHY